MSRRARTLIAALATLATTAVCAGCGLGAGPGTRGISLTITRGFGSREVASVSRDRVPGSETVMRMLERTQHVSTRYGGGFVQSIDGLSGGGREDWFYYVNGVQAPKGAATTAVHAGDHIWWDLHDWSASETVPAVVGSFPEPFVNGIAGKRYPVTVECAASIGAACKRVTAALNAAHVPAAPQLLGAGSGTSTLGIVVGTWRQISGDIAAQLISAGPGTSGVYARFTDRRGDGLELLDPAGRVVRTLRAGAGLIAATAGASGVPTWLVTGTDAAGVDAAARAFTKADLHDHFALAVDGRTLLPVPLSPSS